MYISVRGTPSPAGSGAAGRVPGTVVALGFVSLLTDISTEMVTAVLPLFVTVGLGLSPLAFGVLDGFYQAATAAARIGGGYAADRFGRPRAVAAVGYGLGIVSKALLLPASGLVALSGALGLDRIGKGLRTGPRDALIAGCSPPEALGRSFGVHRALDTLGALLGPVVAFYLLMAVPGDFDAVFTVSMCVAGLGVLLLLGKVAERPAGRAERASIRPREAVRLVLGRPRVRGMVLAAALMSGLTVSDAFIYLTLLDRGAVTANVFPLLFLGTGAVYLAAAVPLGRLADRYGRPRVFLAGHAAIVAAYVVASGADALPMAGLTLGLLGLYYAATDGVLPAATAAMVPGEWRATAISTLQTCVALGRGLAALAFGALWAVTGPSPALLGFAAALVVVLLVVAPTMLGRGERSAG
ncbi:MFS transporter [Spongiactinospora sp. TRM90649]|uniref:MFS transporter n=1 Tax=Spongiactinospora sp. TRM90649 TaxID=3031114 RepID=UPI0023FA4AC1|nr:MFS transporter [Spongiactinospora sp. TRM90649]MDF5758154.1 MFS transporter [Spongiactinospora sp. TRM90649]